MKTFEIFVSFDFSIQVYGFIFREDIEVEIKICIFCILVVIEFIGVDGMLKRNYREYRLKLGCEVYDKDRVEFERDEQLSEDFFLIKEILVCLKFYGKDKGGMDL